MELLLLTDIQGIGKKNDLIVVKSGFALNNLLPERKALVVTPNVRRRYAEAIKKRAIERESERDLQTSVSRALSGKTVHVTAKASKAGKLYAAISEEQIRDSLKTEHEIVMPASSVGITDPIKSIGKHTVTITIGAQSTTVTVEVKAKEAAK